jgi:hypothetical protein
MTVAVADTITIADAYLDTKLSGDADLTAEAPGGVWNEAAEQGTTGRIVRFSYWRGATAKSAGAFGSMEIINNSLMYELLTYLVRMVGDNDRFEDLRAGATRIRQLLHNSRGDAEIDGELIGKVLWCEYIGPPWKERVPDGDQIYPELGGFYQLAVQPPSV